MIKKYAVIMLAIFLLTLSGMGIMEAEAAENSGEVEVSARVVEPGVDMEVADPVVFEVDAADMETAPEKAVGQGEVTAAGTTVIEAGSPWKLKADAPELDNADIYLRISGQGNSGWISAEEGTLLESTAVGVFELGWDVKVVSSEEMTELGSFQVDFELDER